MKNDWVIDFLYGLLTWAVGMGLHTIRENDWAIDFLYGLLNWAVLEWASTQLMRMTGLLTFFMGFSIGLC